VVNKGRFTGSCLQFQLPGKQGQKDCDLSPAWAKGYRYPSSMYKVVMVEYTYNLGYLEAQLGALWTKANLSLKWDPIWKIIKANTAGDVVHRVEDILFKHEALSSNPQTNKQKNEGDMETKNEETSRI
jgi:hypothetical protein